MLFHSRADIQHNGTPLVWCFLHTAADAARWVGLCFINWLFWFGLQDSNMRYLLYILTRLGSCWTFEEIQRRNEAGFQIPRVFQGNLGGYFSRDSRLRLFFLLFSFYSCREADLSVCCVSQQHSDSHSQSYTRSHLGAAEYKHSLLSQTPHGGNWRRGGLTHKLRSRFPRRMGDLTR